MVFNKQKNKTIITTSWDDGSELDLKLLNLLEKYNLKGTFYIPKQSNLTSLTKKEIIFLSENQEIGGHGLTHRSLIDLDLSQVEKEIKGSKKFLENILNKSVDCFCYPKGGYNSEIKKLVKRNSFKCARTVKELILTKPNDFFEMGTSLHVYPFPLRKRDKNHYHISRVLFQPLQKKFSKMRKLNLPIKTYFSWLDLAKCLFDKACWQKGIYHLWGHSWEIERYGMWNDLEKIFKYISDRENCSYFTNGQLKEKL